MITVSDRVVLSAIRSVRKGNDPLGIGSADTSVDAVVRAKDMLHDAFDGVDADTAGRVADMVEGNLARMRKIGNPMGVQPLDALTAALFAHVGIDPLVCSWLVTLENGPGDLHLDSLDTGYQAGLVDLLGANDLQNSTEVMLVHKPYAIWRQKGELMIDPRQLPDMATISSEGRPLRDLVAHPVLDLYEIRIEKVSPGEEAIRIHTDHRPRPVRLDDLVAFAPHGCR